MKCSNIKGQLFRREGVGKDSYEEHLRDDEKGKTVLIRRLLGWEGCCRFSDEPLLSDAEEFRKGITLQGVRIVSRGTAVRGDAKGDIHSAARARVAHVRPRRASS